MLDDTLVIFRGEFVRTPNVELTGNSESKYGRDHNPYGFSMSLPGGVIKGGAIYGVTDEFGFEAVESPVTAHDLHATILSLLGFNHEGFTYRYQGREFRFADVS